MKKQFIFILIATCSLVISSCKDDDNIEEEKYPYTYWADREEYELPKMYTKTGVNTNQEEMKSYLKNVDEKTIIYNPNAIQPVKWLNYFRFDNLIKKVEKEEVAMCTSTDSIKPIFYTSFTSYKEYVGIYTIKTLNGITYWEDTNTSSGLVYDYGNFKMYQNTGELIVLLSDFDSLKPLYHKEFVVPSTSGYSNIIEIKRCMYIIDNLKETYIPHFKMYYKKNELSEVRRPFLAINNIPLPDNEIVSKLAEGDTLIIQPYKLYLNKVYDKQ